MRNFIISIIRFLFELTWPVVLILFLFFSGFSFAILFDQQTSDSLFCSKDDGHISVCLRNWISSVGTVVAICVSLAATAFAWKAAQRQAAATLLATIVERRKKIYSLNEIVSNLTTHVEHYMNYTMTIYNYFVIDQEINETASVFSTIKTCMHFEEKSRHLFSRLQNFSVDILYEISLIDDVKTIISFQDADYARRNFVAHARPLMEKYHKKEISELEVIDSIREFFEDAAPFEENSRSFAVFKTYTKNVFIAFKDCVDNERKIIKDSGLSDNLIH